MSRKRVKTKRRLTAKEWFDRGEEFELAAHALFEGRDFNYWMDRLGNPHVVLRAFGIEAYLKCLIELDLREAPWEHNFLLLFDALSELDRRELTALWQNNEARKLRALNTQKPKGWPMKRVPVSLRGVLRHCGDAFLLFRYGPEEGTAPFLVMNFPVTLRNYVIGKGGFQPKFRLTNNPQPNLAEPKHERSGLVIARPAILNPKAVPIDPLFRIYQRTNPNNRSPK